RRGGLRARPGARFVRTRAPGGRAGERAAASRRLCGVARAARGVSGVGKLLDRYGLPPADIEARSLAYVEAQLVDRLSDDPGERAVSVRVIYAAGDLALVEALRFQPGAVAAAVGALRARRPVVVDVRMLGAAVESG